MITPQQFEITPRGQDGVLTAAGFPSALEPNGTWCSLKSRCFPMKAMVVVAIIVVVVYDNDDDCGGGGVGGDDVSSARAGSGELCLMEG